MNGPSGEITAVAEACWLCRGKGAIAEHIDATRAYGVPLFVAHRPESDSHPVHPCPVCRGD